MQKLSPEFRKFIDGKKAALPVCPHCPDRDDPNAGPKYIQRIHPLGRGPPRYRLEKKALWVNRSMTVRIVGLDAVRARVILSHLYNVYEKNADTSQIRFKWTPRTSALWDNR